MGKTAATFRLSQGSASGGGQFPPALYQGGKALKRSTLHPTPKSFPGWPPLGECPCQVVRWEQPEGLVINSFFLSTWCELCFQLSFRFWSQLSFRFCLDHRQWGNWQRHWALHYKTKTTDEMWPGSTVQLYSLVQTPVLQLLWRVAIQDKIMCKSCLPFLLQSRYYSVKIFPNPKYFHWILDCR